MTKREIVTALAKDRVVETMCMKTAHSTTLTPDLQDLSQIIYIALLENDEARLVDLYETGSLGFFIARMIINQFRTDHSPFRDMVTHFSSITFLLNMYDDQDDNTERS